MQITTFDCDSGQEITREATPEEEAEHAASQEDAQRALDMEAKTQEQRAADLKLISTGDINNKEFWQAFARINGHQE